jgi:hypothetical protein
MALNSTEDQSPPRYEFGHGSAGVTGCHGCVSRERPATYEDVAPLSRLTQPWHTACDSLKQQWAEAASRFHNIMGAARSMNGEMVSIQRRLSAIRTGSLTQAHLDAIRDSNDVVITASRQSLIQQLQAFFAWYDGLLGRP